MESEDSSQELARRLKRSRSRSGAQEVITLSCSCLDCRINGFQQRKIIKLEQDIIIISSSSENEQKGSDNHPARPKPTPIQSKPSFTNNLENVKMEKPTSEQPLECIPWLHVGHEEEIGDEENAIQSNQRSPLTEDTSQLDNRDLTRQWLAGLESEYSIGNNAIGQGAFGSVYAGYRKGDNFPVAIKRIGKQFISTWGEIDGRRVPIEFELEESNRASSHSKLHPYTDRLCVTTARSSFSFITGVIEMIDWRESHEGFQLVMERPSPASDLYDYRKRAGPLPEQKVRSIITQLIKAVQHCHINGVIHRDIKDQNVLINLENMTVKRIDFRCGAVKQILPFKCFHGTPIYSPPEWWSCGRYGGTDFDVWRLGVLLYMLIENTRPFETEREIVNKDVVFFREGISLSCRELIQWMLSKDHEIRPKIHQILRHRWFYEAARPWL